MSKDVLSVLTQVRELLSDPDHWCQGTYAVDSDYSDVPPTSEEACRWCLLGAISKVLPNAEDGALQELIVSELDEAVEQFGDDSLANFNDAEGTTHDDVLALLDTAIEVYEVVA